MVLEKLKEKAGVNAASVLLLFLIVVSAFFNYHKIITIFWLSALTKYIATGLLGLTGLLMYSLQIIRISKIGFIDLAVATFLIYILANTVVKSFPDPPSEDIFTVIILLLYYVLIRCSYANGITGSSQLIITGVIMLSFLQSVVGILQQYEVLSPYDDSFRVAGTFINPGIYGCFLLSGLLFGIHKIRSVADNPLNKIFYIIVCLIVFLALLYSGSRTAWLSLLGGIICLGITGRRITGFLKKYKTLFLYVTGIGLVILIYFIFRINVHSIDGRFLIWKVLTPMIMINPLTGLGYGSYFIQYGNFQADYFLDDKASENEIQLASMNYYVFNEYLKILIEEGVVGFFLFILILTSIGGFICRKVLFSYAFAGYHSGIPHVSFSVGTALLLFGFFSYPSQDISINIILLSVVSWLADLQAKDPESRQISLIPGKQALHIICGISLLLVILSIVKTGAILKWKTAKENILVQEGTSLHTYAAIWPILSDNGAFLYNYGSELNAIGRYAEASDVLKRARLYGNSVELQMLIADNMAKLGDFKEAERYYLKAASMNPKLFVPYETLLDFYVETGQYSKAKHQAAALCHKRIKVRSPKVLEIKEKACKYIKQYDTL
ncbi:O-antigen ligase family protein [Sphingobacterium spiritivorum]|uniref:O-antigen ligase family protein n=1 Tax=Sphingobacterium spiritivorum TaxID=258 RepID=UPI003DA1DE9C